MKVEFLLELGVEDLPASYVNLALSNLQIAIAKKMQEERIDYDEVSVGATPVRISICFKGVATEQRSQNGVILGPPKHIAYEANGSTLTKAGEKFLEKNNFTREQVFIENTEKGEFIAGRFESSIAKTETILPNIVTESIAGLQFKKTMRWGDGSMRFARPIKYICALFGSKILPIKYGYIESSNKINTHRFLGSANVEVSSYDDYINKLKKDYVVLNYQERYDEINAFLNGLNKKSVDTSSQPEVFSELFKLDYDVLLDEELIDETACLVEKPYPIIGQFDKRYLNLPKEVLTIVLKQHQRYFVIEDNKSETLINYFIGVSNVPFTPYIKAGYEKVVTARLDDAEFFFKNDSAKSAEHFNKKLSTVIYQDKLGTMSDKVERIVGLTKFLCEKLGIAFDESMKNTARNCKFDLTTEMVFEFPELQGIMGYKYAKTYGLNEDVARGIYEHYLPKSAEDNVPSTNYGSIVAIADKLDSIIGNFALGNIPTGSEDPLGLRRAGNGIAIIVMSKEYSFDLAEVVASGISLYREWGVVAIADERAVIRDVVNFIKARLRTLKSVNGRELNWAYDTIDAGIDYSANIIKVTKLMDAIEAMRKNSDFNTVAQNIKRVGNILKKSSDDNSIKDQLNGKYDASLLNLLQERELSEAMTKVSDNVIALVEKDEYTKAITELVALAPHITNFFDNVMVNDNDMKIRINRLNLLNALHTLYAKIGDVSKLS